MGKTVEERKDYQRRWYLKNQDAHRARRKLWYRANKRKARETLRVFYQQNPEMQLYIGMRQRCTNPNRRGYNNYGGRGIKCLFSSFKEFINHIGPRPSPQHSVDRIDTNGHYAPGNVRWATSKEQNRNRRNLKLSQADTPKINQLIRTGHSSSVVAALYGCSASHITQVAKGRYWQ